MVEAGAPLIRLDDTRFQSNVGETETVRLSMLLRVERLSAEVDDRGLPRRQLAACRRVV